MKHHHIHYTNTSSNVMKKLELDIINLEKFLHEKNLTNCTKYIEELTDRIKTQQWNAYKMSYENLYGADMYTIVILLLFASIIIILMIRAIKPSDNIDDQVVMMLNSMRARVDIEHNYREKKKLREAKAKIQAWLSDVKQKGVNRLSFRNRSASQYIHHESSVRRDSPLNVAKFSNSTTYSSRKQSTASLRNKKAPINESYSQNSFYSFFVPEIVVTNEHSDKESNSSLCSLADFNEDNEAVSSASSCPASRPLSSNSGEASNSSEAI